MSFPATIHAAIFDWRVSVRARNLARKSFEQCAFGGADRASLEYRQCVQRYRVAVAAEAAAYDALGRVVYGLIDQGTCEWSGLADEFGLSAALVSNLRLRRTCGIRGTDVSEVS